MKKYTQPNLEIEITELNDVILASTGDDPFGNDKDWETPSAI